MRSSQLLNAERLALLGQLFRYGISGLLASLVNIGIYHVGVKTLHLDPNLAWTVGFLGAATVAYIIHSQWSFKGHGSRDNLWRQTTRFFIVSLISFALNSFWVWLLVKHFALPTWSPYPFALFVTPLLIFWLNRQWVFE
jgi:putative flippase GtrA